MMVMVMIMMTIIHECTDKSLSSIGDDENVAQMLQKYFNYHFAAEVTKYIIWFGCCQFLIVTMCGNVYYQLFSDKNQLRLSSN